MAGAGAARWSGGINQAETTTPASSSEEHADVQSREGVAPAQISLEYEYADLPPKATRVRGSLMSGNSDAGERLQLPSISWHRTDHTTLSRSTFLRRATIDDEQRADFPAPSS